MSVYLKQFSTHAEYDAYINGSGAILPNVSICTTEGDVHYNPFVIVTGVTLNKSTLNLSKGETETLVATVLPSNASNKSVTWSSSNDSVATVSNSGLVTAIGDSGNANITVTTVDGGHTAQCAFNIIDPCASEKVETTYDYVEIGGVKWSTKNVGALTVTDYGQKFSWGGISGYTNDQISGSCKSKRFGFSDYEHSNGTPSPSDTGITKYNNTDSKTVLELVDDAATVNMGSGWRMPTKGEYVALGNAVNTVWTTDYQGSGVAGLVCTDKTDSSKVLFFPAAGVCDNGSVSSVGSYSMYWSSSLNTSNIKTAYGTTLGSSFLNWSGDFSRYNGRAVRGVYIG